MHMMKLKNLMGAGAYNKNYKNYFGMIGVNGENSANELIKQSDLIISFGCRFNNRITCIFNQNEIFSKLVQININEEYKSSDFIQGDINCILSKFKITILNFQNGAILRKNSETLIKPIKKSQT